MNRSPVVLAIAFIAVTLAGCSTQSPVVYPNAHLEKMGHGAYEADLADCGARAEQYAGHASGNRGNVAERAAEGAIIGGASGAASGAAGRGSVGRGAASRAAGRATAGALGGIFNTQRPNPVVRRFVERCMKERGWEIIGWG